MKSEDDLYHFDFVGGNGQVLATSPLYRTKNSAISAIESVRTSAQDAVFEDRTTGETDHLT